MGGLLMILALVCSLASLVCGLIIVIDAFKNEWWKGLLCFVTCGLYTLYYAIVEYTADNKWLIVGIWLGGAFVGGALQVMAGAAMHR